VFYKTHQLIYDVTTSQPTLRRCSRRVVKNYELLKLQICTRGI